MRRYQASSRGVGVGGSRHLPIEEGVDYDEEEPPQHISAVYLSERNKHKPLCSVLGG